MRIQDMKPGERIVIGGVTLTCFRCRTGGARIGLEDQDGNPVQELPPREDCREVIAEKAENN